MVRVLGPKAEDTLSLLDRDERILGHGAVGPFVHRRKLQFFRQNQRCRGRSRREGHDALAKACRVQHGLEILLNRRELPRPDVEGVVHLGSIEGQTEEDRLAEIFHIKELIAILPVARQREVLAIFGPIVKHGENAEAFGANEGLGPENRHTHASCPVAQTEFFRLDLRLTVRANAVHPIGLKQRMVIGNAIDCRRRDVDTAFDPVRGGGLNDIARAINISRKNIGGFVERERGGGMHHQIYARHRLHDGGLVADVARMDGNARPLRIIERGNVEGAHLVATVEEVANEVNAKEPGPAGD